MTIIRLSKEYLAETIRLVESVFPSDVKTEWSPARTLRMGLRYSEDLDADRHGWLKKLGYWVVINENKEIIGVTGLYQPGDDNPDTAWVGWYCVRPDQRGKGLGRELLEWTIAAAKSQGYKKLKLYTSTDPAEARAQELYEKVGLKIIGQEKGDGLYTTLYREKDL